MSLLSLEIRVNGKFRIRVPCISVLFNFGLDFEFIGGRPKERGRKTSRRTFTEACIGYSFVPFY